jgi:nucleoside-diphosphate-sugar epimerase
MPVGIIGAGYVGSRVLARLGPGQAVAFGRSRAPGQTGRDLDLDHDLPTSGTVVPDKVLYTVPPSVDSDNDSRLARFLASLHEPPRRIVYLSTSGVYGDCGGALVVESREPAPLTPRARRRLAAESMLQDWCSKFAVACIIFRVPGIYGPGRLGVERIRAGEPFIRESEANPGNRIHADDLASASIAALERNIPDGIYNVCDGDFRSSTWFALTVARLAGLAAPPLISRAEALETLPASRLSFLGESRRLDTRKMHDVLHFRVKFPNAEHGIRASLREDGLLSD